MLVYKPRRIFFSLFFLALLAGCATLVSYQLDELYGAPQVRDRTLLVDAVDNHEPEFFHDVKPILDQRCVVCHGCYDAPCQLKLSAYEGLDRGASKEIVYNGTRLLSATPSRLFVDAKDTQGWRDRQFYPVLNEREQTPVANLQGSSFYRMLALKQKHPLPTDAILPDSFDFNLNRDQQCAKVEEFDQFEKDYPLWGMPYGLPAIDGHQMAILKRWLTIGSPVKPRQDLSKELQAEVSKWEAFFNGDSLKHQLVARYMFEHLFIANLYFPELSQTQFFKMVRSHTPSGVPTDVIGSRRPFDDPGAAPFYYRLEPVKTTILTKNHMPYRLDAERMQRWQTLFFDTPYTVEYLPSYQGREAANPFAAFEQLPMQARYKFMLDEAKFTISGFIKGPVCRGQTALNVINDQFWVFFVNPDSDHLAEVTEFLKQEKSLYRLPAEKESIGIPLTRWLTYSKLQGQLMEAKIHTLNKVFPSNEELTLDLLWDGDGNNQNAALTVFRHFDSATVKQGMIGGYPKTAWVISYSLLERLHYLLVSGFDVYGNVSHQLLTRLYMDFLRMEGESNFLSLLPSKTAEDELALWYRGAESSVSDYLAFIRSRDNGTTGIDFVSNQPKYELFDLINNRFGESVVLPDPINRPKKLAVDDPVLFQIQRLASLKGIGLTPLPEYSLLRVNMDNGKHRVFSVVRNLSHSNVSSLFSESKRYIREEQSLTIFEGVLGDYPNGFYDVDDSKIVDFVDQFMAIRKPRHYAQLLDNYGVRRTSNNFWSFSDWIHTHYKKSDPIAAGLLDYNRLENR